MDFIQSYSLIYLDNIFHYLVLSTPRAFMLRDISRQLVTNYPKNHILHRVGEIGKITYNWNTQID